MGKNQNVHPTQTKNGRGYILGDFFHKLIWSPCSFVRCSPGEKYNALGQCQLAFGPEFKPHLREEAPFEVSEGLPFIHIDITVP
jgi:hypothetical protein